MEFSVQVTCRYLLLDVQLFFKECLEWRHICKCIALRSLEFTQVEDPSSLPQHQWLVEHEVGTDDSIHICIHSSLNEALMRE